MRNSFYSSAAWRQVRARVIERDSHRCQAERLLGGACSSDLHAHHVIPATVCQDPLDESNLVTVCGIHHRELDVARRSVRRGRANAAAYQPFQHAA